jgi:hypothetical protein
LADLKSLNKLETLLLGGTKVTANGLAYLRGLNTLSGIDLAGTQITDAGLAHLTTVFICACCEPYFLGACASACFVVSS